MPDLLRTTVLLHLESPAARRLNALGTHGAEWDILMQVQQQFTKLCEKHKAEQESMEELLSAREDAYLDLLHIPAVIVPRHTPVASSAAASSNPSIGPFGFHSNGHSPKDPASNGHSRASLHEDQSPRSGTEAARPRPSGLFGLGGFF